MPYDPYTTAVPPAVERGTEAQARAYLAVDRAFPAAAVDAAVDEARRFPGRYAYLPPDRYAYVVKHMPAGTWTAGDSTATERRIAALPRPAALMARDFAAEERQRWGGPSPHAGQGERPLTRTERIEARHLLQELSEHALSVRNAMDPVSGMHTIRLDQWRAQYDSLIAQLRYFTERLS